jgi:hypothetical protein
MRDLALMACMAFIIEEPMTLEMTINIHAIARSVALNVALMAVRVQS